MTPEELSAEVKRVVSTPHRFPDGLRRVSARTVRRWRQYYRDGRPEPGLKALQPKTRNDQGQPRALELEAIERAVRLREEMPSRKTGRLIELMNLESLQSGQDKSDIKESTLNYHLRQRKATRKKLASKSRVFRRFQHPHRNSCWQGDWADGIWLPNPAQPSKKRKCFLHGFIDDRTRYIPHAEFYFRQNLPCLEDCFRKAILKGGVPEMTYVDNGASYQAKQFKKIAARLTTNLVFATAYCPEGKGKVERWIRTVKDDFFEEASLADIKTLEELNTFLWSWLENVYHSRVHSSTKASPRELWSAESDRARSIEPEKMIDIFLWEEDRKVDKSGTFQLDGNHYPVSEHLVRESIQVRFNPFDLEHVRVYHQGQFVEAVSPEQIVNHTYNKALPRRHNKHAPLESSKNFRRQLTEGYQNQLREATSALPKQTDSHYLTEPKFIRKLSQALNRTSLRASEKNHGFKFFQTHAPLPEKLVERALSEAVSENGSKLHLTVYLRKIKEALRVEKGVL